MGIGDYDEALNQLKKAADNPELLQYAGGSGVGENFWFDPMLEQPEFVEVRERLRAR